MSRAVIVLNSGSDITRAVDWIGKAPPGTRVEFKGPKRSLDQNARMWAMLTDLITQCDDLKRDYGNNTDKLKVACMHACGIDLGFIPSLNDFGPVPYLRSSSDLSVAEMSNLLEFIAALGAERGVVFQDDAKCAP